MKRIFKLTKCAWNLDAKAITDADLQFLNKCYFIILILGIISFIGIFFVTTAIGGIILIAICVLSIISLSYLDHLHIRLDNLKECGWIEIGICEELLKKMKNKS